MRPAFRSCLLFSVALALGSSRPPSASAQTPAPQKFIRVDFMKVVEGKEADYVKLEETWKTVHQDRVGKGQIESWSRYAVRLPPWSTSREYDAVTMTVFGSFAKMDQPYDEDQMARIRSFTPADEFRKMVRSEIWTVYRSAGDLLASKFATVLFHKAKPGQLADYLKAQTEHYAPINEELVKSGVRRAWHSLGVVYPSGVRNEYDWVTFDGFDTFDAPAGNTTAGIAPERVQAAGRAVSAHRDVTRNEYWQLIGRTAPR